MQKDRSATYTAKGIYESCKDSKDSNKPSGDYPIGNPKWIKFGLEYIVNIIPVQTSALSSESVKNILNQNKPIFVYLINEKTDEGHAMVLYYYMEIDSSNGQYVFMDPSKGSGALSVMIDGSVMKDGTNITLTCRSGHYFNYWKYSFYEG